MALPINDWLQSLSQMDESIAADERDLVQHEHAVLHLLEEKGSSVALQGAETLLAQIEERLERHDRGQRAAAAHVQSFEHWLGQQEAAVGQWRSAFTEWCGRIQHSQSR